MTTGDPGSGSGSARIDDPVVLALFEHLPDADAKESIVAQSQPLAEYLARRFAGRGEPLDDLIQVANIGLLGAIERSTRPGASSSRRTRRRPWSGS